MKKQLKNKNHLNGFGIGIRKINNIFASSTPSYQYLGINILDLVSFANYTTESIPKM